MHTLRIICSMKIRLYCILAICGEAKLNVKRYFKVVISLNMANSYPLVSKEIFFILEIF
jgi:hypothetical protein